MKKPTKSKAGQRCKREVQAKEPPSVAMVEIEPRTKKLPYTLVEFWSDLEIIWNFIYETLKEKNRQRQVMGKKRQLWIKKCNQILQKWRRERIKKRFLSRDEISLPDALVERNGRKKYKLRFFVLRSGHDYNLEVVPCVDKKRRKPNLTENQKRENCCLGPKVTSPSPSLGQIEKISAERKGKWHQIGKKVRRTEKGKEAEEVCCALCLAHGGHLARCRGCRRVRYCSEDCQREDWRRHRPICGMSKKLEKRNEVD